MARIGLFGVLLAGATLVASATVVAGGSQAGIGTQEGPLRVLFVGSSGTRSNDMPAKVARFAALSGRVLQYRTVLHAGFTLEDHWNLGAARAALASVEWDVVVLQDRPPYLPEDQENLRIWAGRWAGLAREAGTRPALLTVWPDLERRSAMPDVVLYQRLAAQAAGAQLLPAAEAWQAAWRCGLHLSLYGPDGVHASPLGTYEIALVAYGGLYGEPVRSRRLYPLGEKPRTARLLQAAAATALGRRLRPGSRCG
jgi:hypothetical protein